MKVKIKDLNPNPFRGLNKYPVSQEKILALEASIKQTGFWENLLAREVNGEIQIAYGHHRLEALKNVYSPEFEIDISVKELDDATMLKIMANENMVEWSATPAVIDQIVQSARDFLLANPDIAKNYGQVHKSSQTGENLIGAVLIASFLNWKQTKVSDSLGRLNIISSGTIKQMTIEFFDTEGSARTFVQKIKEHEDAGNPIPMEKHQEIALKFKASGNRKKVLEEAVKEVLNEKALEVEQKDKPFSPTGLSEVHVGDKEETDNFPEIIAEFCDAERGFQNALLKIIAYYGESEAIPQECQPYHTSMHAKLIMMKSTIVSLIERLVRRPDSFKTIDPIMNE